MKLLFCKKCHSVFNLNSETKRCFCGEVGGYYKDNLNAVYFGKPAVTIGFENTSFVESINLQPEKGMAKSFFAFVIPKNCKTFKKVKDQ